MEKMLKAIKYRKAIIVLGVVIAILASFFAGAYVDDIEIGKVRDDTYLNGRDEIFADKNTGSAGGAYVENGEASDTAEQEDNRKIIKTVTETVQTENFASFVSSLKMFVSETGGRIDSERSSGENYYNSNSLRTAYFAVRIPADQLSYFTSKVDSISAIVSYSENKLDVTEAYIGIESRISVLEAKEASLLEMLKSAATVSDLLEIDERLTSVQADLAALKAQKESYDSRIEYSTVNLTVNEVRRAMTEDPTFGESVRDEFLRSLDDIGAGVENLGIFLFGNVLYLLIFFAVAALAIPSVKHFVKKRKQKAILNKVISSEELSTANPNSDTPDKSNE